MTMIGFFSLFVRSLALTLAALLPIVNPPGSAAIFLSMTPGASNRDRTILARQVARNSLALLAAAVIVGSYVLSFFGLPLSVVKIAGGLLVTATGWRLSSQPNIAPEPATADPDSGAGTDLAQRVFYPFTFPLTVGPGSISVAVTLGAGTHDAAAGMFAGVAGTTVGIVLVAVAVYFCYRFAAVVLRALGATGTVVFLRLSAFVLLAVGIQILCDGITERFIWLSGK